MGIDQSYTCTGYCIISDGKLIHYGTIVTKPDKDEDVMIDHIKRSRHISAELLTIHNAYNVTRVGMEGMSFASKGSATRSLGILYGSITRALPNIPVIVPPMTLKKFATGKGNADKEDMFLSLAKVEPDFANELMSIPKTKGRYDIVDAYWLTQYIQGTL